MAPLTLEPTSIPLSLASCSIGLPKHTLHQKLEAISQSGFKGIEIAFPNLLAHAKELQSLQQLPQGEIKENDWPTLCKAAEHVRHLCETHGLSIVIIQPFSNFEGWIDENQRKALFEKAKGWVQIMKALGTDMMQVGATDTPGHKITSDKNKIAADLAELADLFAQHGLRIAYENWCWATHGKTWKDVWEIVKLVDRKNVGLCLDTFQSAGYEWADPTTASGLVEGVSESALETSWKESLRELVSSVPADKIFVLQISDAYRVSPPLAPHPEPNDDSGLRPRGRWSHDYRPLPYDGGYLGKQCVEFSRAVLDTGFRGYFSVEVFDGQFEKKYGDDLVRFTETARDNTVKLVEDAANLESL